MKTDTIAAIATAVSDSGIGIVRVSGDDAVKIAAKIFQNARHEKILDQYASHTIHYGFITKQNGDVIDEVMVSVMKAPRSYTMEDTVEINCHGGALMMRKILMTVIEAGARAAEPGEFTKRAFLNGRMDLSEAEAVMDIIHAKNEFALQSSVKQLQGSVCKKIKELRDKIIYEIAFIESALDDPENYNTDGYDRKLSCILENIGGKIRNLIDHADDGRILKEGIRTVILGKPNAGKSSFLNELLGEEKAIVTNIAGTTRDVLEETIKLGGISLHIMDTAGIRKTEDTVEILDILREKHFIVLLNKSDLNMVVTEKEISDKLRNLSASHESSYVDRYSIIKISALKHQGIDEFERVVKRMFFQGDVSFNSEVIITSMRHKEALQEAQESISMVQKSIEAGMSEDFYSIDLMNAYAALGKIIGEEVGDDLVNEIFEKFCMGK